jgi:hypothetical protein
MEMAEWYAWIDLMPPRPNRLHVIGEVLVGNPGVRAFLCKRYPQGINPSILMLDLHQEQSPGIWAQVMTWVDCRYEKVLGPASPKYGEVHVYHNNVCVQQLKVDEVH